MNWENFQKDIWCPSCAVWNMCAIMRRFYIVRWWSLLIPGTEVEQICLEYQNLRSCFIRLWKILLAFSQATKTCSYFITEKKQKAKTKPRNIYFKKHILTYYRIYLVGISRLVSTHIYVHFILYQTLRRRWVILNIFDVKYIIINNI